MRSMDDVQREFLCRCHVVENRGNDDDTARRMYSAWPRLYTNAWLRRPNAVDAELVMLHNHCAEASWSALGRHRGVFEQVARMVGKSSCHLQLAFDKIGISVVYEDHQVVIDGEVISVEENHENGYMRRFGAEHMQMLRVMSGLGGLRYMS